jgi:hypothetical protein
MAVTNLGFIQAVHEGGTPPTNTKILWLDTSSTPAVRKVYNTTLSIWEAFLPDVSYREQVRGVFNSAGTSLPLTTATTIDGLTVADGDRFLVIDSATAGQIDKIYKAAVSGIDITWSIEQDGTGADDPVSGHTVWSKEGTTYQDKRWNYETTAWAQDAGGGGSSSGAVNILQKSDGAGGFSASELLSATYNLDLGLSTSGGTAREIVAIGSGVDLDLTLTPKGAGDILAQGNNLIIGNANSGDLQLGATTTPGADRTITAQGSVANIDLSLVPKGTGEIFAESSITNTAGNLVLAPTSEITRFGVTDYLDIDTSGVGYRSLLALGSETHISLYLTPKGSGDVNITNGRLSGGGSGLVIGEDTLTLGYSTTAGTTRTLSLDGSQAVIDYYITPKGSGGIHLSGSSTLYLGQPTDSHSDYYITAQGTGADISVGIESKGSAGWISLYSEYLAALDTPQLDFGAGFAGAVREMYIRGTASTVGFNLFTKGAGNLLLDTASGASTGTTTITSQDYYFGPTAIAGGLTFNVRSQDANADLNFVPKGTGTLTVPAGYESNVTADGDIPNKAYVDSVAGGGATSQGAVDIIQLSDGAGAFLASSLSEGTAGDLELGVDTVTAGTERKVSALGSGSNLDISFVTKGTGALKVPVGYESNISQDYHLINRKFAQDNYWKVSGTSTVTSAVIQTVAASNSLVIGSYAGSSTSAISFTHNGANTVSYFQISHADSGGETVNFSFDIDNLYGDGAGVIFADGRTTKKGIEYKADYSAGFTSRSLIDVGFGDATYVALKGTNNLDDSVGGWDLYGATDQALTIRTSSTGGSFQYFSFDPDYGAADPGRVSIYSYKVGERITLSMGSKVGGDEQVYYVSHSADSSPTTVHEWIRYYGYTTGVTVGSGFGTKVLYSLETDTNADRNAGGYDFYWINAADASRSGGYRFFLYDVTTVRYPFQLTADNNASFFNSAINPTFGDTTEGKGVLHIADVLTTPVGTLTQGGGLLYVSGTSLYFHDDSGASVDLTSVGAPGGSNGDIQYNNASSFGGFGDWSGTKLTVGGDLQLGSSTTDQSLFFTTETNTYINSQSSGKLLYYRAQPVVGNVLHSFVNQQDALGSGVSTLVQSSYTATNHTGTSAPRAFVANIAKGASVSTGLFTIAEFQSEGVSQWKWVHDGYAEAIEITAPSGTPTTGYGYLFVDSADSKIKFKNDGGTTYDLTAGTGGTPGGADTNVQYNNGGAFGGFGAWDDVNEVLRIDREDAGTSNVVDQLILRRNSTGTPAGGFGNLLSFELESSTTVGREAARVQASWQVATDASREGNISLWYDDVGTMREAFNASPSTGSAVKWTNGTTVVDLIIGSGGSPFSLHNVTTTNTTGIGASLQYLMDSTGTPTNGFGSVINYNLESSTTANRNAVDMSWYWDTAADASRSSAMKLTTYYVASSYDQLILEANGGDHRIRLGSPFKPYAVAAASLPTASNYDQYFLYITDEELLAYSDGSDWLRIGVAKGGSSTQTGTTYTMDCGNNQQYTETIDTNSTNTLALTLSNFDLTATLFIEMDGATDKTINLQGTSMVFIDMSNKVTVTAAASPIALTIPGGAGYTHTLIMNDSGIVDGTDRVIHVTQL